MRTGSTSAHNGALWGSLGTSCALWLRLRFFGEGSHCPGRFLNAGTTLRRVAAVLFVPEPKIQEQIAEKVAVSELHVVERFVEFSRVVDVLVLMQPQFQQSLPAREHESASDPVHRQTA